MSRPIIEVEGLSKRYRLGQFNAGSLREEAERLMLRLRGRGHAAAKADATDFWALKDVSFSVQPGEVLGVIGRNGAGKSTLLKILSRVTEPTSGQVRIRGRVASLLEVGTGFHPELTGRENIYLNGAILGMTRAEITAKFDEIVDFSGVETFLDTPVKRYSSGMYVRLAFAVAAHLEPEVLIVDEVLAVGDAEFQKKCLGKMQDISGKGGRTVLFVSHNMAAVQTLCQRVMLLRSGAIEAIGPNEKVTQEYLHSSISETQKNLNSSGTRHIRSVRLTAKDGTERENFQVGDTIVFEVELFSDRPIDDPRFGLGICAPNGERIATLHTDVQFSSRWSIDGTRRLRAVWKGAPLNVGDYRVDASLWSFDRDEETLIGVKTLRIESRDVYGTGRLPDPSFQGVLVPDARWSFDAVTEDA